MLLQSLETSRQPVRAALRNKGLQIFMILPDKTAITSHTYLVVFYVRARTRQWFRSQSLILDSCAYLLNLVLGSCLKSMLRAGFVAKNEHLILHI